MANTKPKILLSGMLAKVPNQGGAAWVVLQYFIGLRQLGHDVHFVEAFSGNAISPAGATLSDSENAACFRQVMQAFGLEQFATLVNTDTKETVGLDYDDLLGFNRQCDVLLNLSGLLDDDELMESIPIRVYVDIDPGFTQLWHVQEGLDVGLSRHNRFVTIGMLIGQPDCPVPVGDLNWVKTLQPIVLEHWPVAGHVVHDALTTIANWRGYGSIEYGGKLFGQKAHSLRRFFELPGSAGEQFMLALAIHHDEISDLEKLNQYGWQLVDPAIVADTPQAFRKFIRESKAEFGIAKSGYVEANCGWFSDRSICYLASGRPVIAQQTGFGAFLPTGDGLFAFENEEDVLSSIAALNRDYAHHCKAARKLAEDYFDSRKVLSSLLANIGVGS